MKAAVYIRVSTLDQAREGYSLSAQRKTLTEWCATRGYEVYNLGYNLDGKDSLIINETEAEVVRLIFQKFIEYQSYLPVAEIVNAMGHHGRRGSSFNAESIKKIVTRPVYIGYYSFKGHLYQGDYEPLISEKDWRHAQRIVQKIRCGRRKYIR